MNRKDEPPPAPERPTSGKFVPKETLESSTRMASSTASTHPEMPAVRERLDVPATKLPKLLHSSQPLFADDDEPVTEVGVRIARLSQPSPSASARDRAVFQRMDGVHAGELHALGSVTTLGRHPSCGIRIDDTGVSRFHARIELEGREHFIQDLESKNGTFVQEKLVSRARLNDGDWVQLGPRVGFRYSITDAGQEELLKRLYESSTRDALTGAYNRKHFDERLHAEVAFALRHGTEASLVLFDIDFFKKINDEHGHQAGDKVLQQIAQTAQRRLRTEDLLARFGGEEFAIVLRGTDRAAGGLVAERLRAMIGALPVIIERTPVPITISAGCASLACCQVKTPAELVAVADRRLYVAKRGGRNRVVSRD